MIKRNVRRRARPVRAGLFLVILISLCFPRTAQAANTGVVSGTGGDGAWLKAGPHVSTARISLLAEGTALTVLGGPRTSDDGYQWFNVETLGQVGWMVGDYLRQTTSAPPPQATPRDLAPGGYGRVIDTAAYGGLKLRVGPAPWEAILKAMPDGTVVKIVDGPVVGGNGNDWYAVAHEGQQGWVDGSYLAPSAPPAPQAPTTAGLAPGGTAVVTGVAAYGGLKLRTAPAPWEELIAVLSEGTTLRILEGPTIGGNGDPWYRLAWGGSWGWASGVYLRPSGATSSGSAATFVQVALEQLGKPYVWGATGPNSFDCSGLTYYAAHKALGIILPRVADQQAFAGVHVDRADLIPGDLVFYENTYGPGITHVGIYIGNNQWVNAANAIDGIIISSLDEPYWDTRYVGARRIV